MKSLLWVTAFLGHAAMLSCVCVVHGQERQQGPSLEAVKQGMANVVAAKGDFDSSRQFANVAAGLLWEYIGAMDPYNGDDKPTLEGLQRAYELYSVLDPVVNDLLDAAAVPKSEHNITSIQSNLTMLLRYATPTDELRSKLLDFAKTAPSPIQEKEAILVLFDLGLDDVAVHEHLVNRLGPLRDPIAANSEVIELREIAMSYPVPKLIPWIQHWLNMGLLEQRQTGYERDMALLIQRIGVAGVDLIPILEEVRQLFIALGNPPGRDIPRNIAEIEKTIRIARGIEPAPKSFAFNGSGELRPGTPQRIILRDCVYQVEGRHPPTDSGEEIWARVIEHGTMASVSSEGGQAHRKLSYWFWAMFFAVLFLLSLTFLRKGRTS